MEKSNTPIYRLFHVAAREVAVTLGPVLCSRAHSTYTAITGHQEA